MKFHKTLEKGQVNAWKEFYIPYDELKNTIKNNKEGFENEIIASLAKADGFYLKLEGLILEEKNKIIKRVKKKIDERKKQIGNEAANSSSKNDLSGTNKSVIRETNMLSNREQNGSDCVAGNNDGKNINCKYDGTKLNGVFSAELAQESLKDIPGIRSDDYDNIKKIQKAEDLVSDENSKFSIQKPFEKLTFTLNHDDKEKTNITDITQNTDKNELTFISEKGATSINKDVKIKGESKKYIRSFDDNSITYKQKRTKNQNKFSIFNLFSIKDKYSQRQREKKITKLIEVCESMKSYAQLNYTGFRKSIKKYDKRHNENKTDKLMPIVRKSYFYRSKRIERVTDELKGFYKEYFAGNDKRKAKNVFENILRREKTSQISSFFSGSFLSLSIFIYQNIIFEKGDMTKSVFIGVNMIFYGFILFGFCMLMFRKYYIHYSFIFDFDITTQESIGTYFFIISTFSLVHNMGYFLFQKYNWSNPVIVVYINMILLIFPSNVLYGSSRYYFVFALAKIVFSPLFTVQFRHFYIADCLQSFTYAYKLIYLYFDNNSKAITLLGIILLPCLFRILQCFKRGYEEIKMKVHMLNALKYGITISFIVSSHLNSRINNYWTLSSKICFGLVSSFYSLYWDLIRDWEIKRRIRIYSFGLHVLIILYNIICRFLWIYTHIYNEFEIVAAFLEIHRRFAWSLMRVECEHLNNRDNLKAIIGFTDKLSDMFYKEDDELESGVSEDDKIDGPNGI